MAIVAPGSNALCSVAETAANKLGIDETYAVALIPRQNGSVVVRLADISSGDGRKVDIVAEQTVTSAHVLGTIRKQLWKVDRRVTQLVFREQPTFRNRHFKREWVLLDPKTLRVRQLKSRRVAEAFNPSV